MITPTTLAELRRLQAVEREAHAEYDRYFAPLPLSQGADRVKAHGAWVTAARRRDAAAAIHLPALLDTIAALTAERDGLRARNNRMRMVLETISCHGCLCSPEQPIDTEERLCAGCEARAALSPKKGAET